MLVVCFHQKIPTGLNFTTFAPGLYVRTKKLDLAKRCDAINRTATRLAVAGFVLHAKL